VWPRSERSRAEQGPCRTVEVVGEVDGTSKIVVEVGSSSMTHAEMSRKSAWIRSTIKHPGT
jgi:hypothetical protein